MAAVIKNLTNLIKPSFYIGLVKNLRVQTAADFRAKSSMPLYRYCATVLFTGYLMHYIAEADHIAHKKAVIAKALEEDAKHHAH